MTFWKIVSLLFFIATNHSKIIFVVEMVDFGIRSPVYASKYFPLSSWPNGLIELTGMGMRQQYLLGREIQNRYIKNEPLLSENYNKNEIYIRSTNANRTIMTAYSQLLGIYPENPHKLSKAEEDLSFPPNKHA